MNSFTSNSKLFTRNLPITKGRLFLLSILVTILILFFGVEILLCLKTFPPLYDISDAVWFRNLRSICTFPNTTKVVFYGSSRTQLGISPDVFIDQMSKLNRQVKCWNLALSASEDAGIVAHMGENIYADIVVIEQFGSQFSTPIRKDDIKCYKEAKNKTWGYHLEDRIQRYLGKNMLIFRDNIPASFFYNRYYKLEAHDNGWIEARYNRDLQEIQKMKDHNVGFSATLQQIPLEDARLAQKLYQEYFNKVLNQGSHLVILRMPVDGEQRKQEDKLLSVGYHTDFLVQNKDILYIDANTHPKLSKYRPIENSHLDASDAIAFSKELAGIIDDWLRRKDL